MKQTHEKDVDQLNAFLKGELSAVETYRQCIEKIDDPLVAMQLRRLQTSHQQRAMMLTQKIQAMGGAPAKDSGVWGAFAKLVEGGAAMLGESSAISTLEEGEDHGKTLYQRDVKDLSPSTREFIEQNIIPEQQRTHDALAALQKRF
jgi:uncharacterized protein (TIGR02284 family)